MKVKNKLFKQIRIFFFIGALLITGSVLLMKTPVESVASEVVTNEDVTIKKEAIPVEGMVNQWDINLTIEGVSETNPKDIVLVVDISSSMKSKVLVDGKLVTRITALQWAAENFANKILEEGSLNRIAIVPFNENSTKYYPFSSSSSEVVANINNLTALGNTNIQAGLKSTKDYLQEQPLTRDGKKISRNIILLSDGLPYFSYKPSNEEYLLPYVNGVEMMELAPESEEGIVEFNTSKLIESFDYNTRVGSGSGIRSLISEEIDSNNISPLIKENNPDAIFKSYYSHINSSIAEANLIKKAKHKNNTKISLVDNIFAVGMDPLSLGSYQGPLMLETMKGIATENQFYEVSSAGLDDMLEQIANMMSNSINEGVITESIASGFELDNLITSENITHGSINVDADSTANQPKIVWNIESVGISGKGIPKLTYRVNANQKILEDNLIDVNNLANTNATTTLDYKDLYDNEKMLEIASPKVRPIITSIEKKLLDENNHSLNNNSDKFIVEIGNDQYTNNDKFEIYPNNEKIRIVHPWKANTKYTVSEKLVIPEDYETSVKINNVVTEGTQSELLFSGTEPDYVHQEIVVTNKKVIREIDAKLHIRQVVLSPNEDLVVPSKAFIHGILSDKPEMGYHLTTGSSTKDKMEEITQELFTTYQIRLTDDYVLNLTDIIPEYYYLYGYIITSDGNELGHTHTSTNLELLKKDNEVSLNYLDSEEYWVTYFIQPKLGEKEKFPRPYSWSYKTNEFGKSL